MSVWSGVVPAAPPLPPNATPNITSIANALQQSCGALANASAGGLSSDQQDLLRRCTFFLGPPGSGSALAAAYNAVVGQQVNALGPQAKKFASLQQDNVTSRLAELRHGSAGISLSGSNPLTSDVPLLAATDPTAYVPAGGAAGTPALLDGRLGAFVNGSIKTGSKANSRNSFAFDIDDKSVTVGADYRITEWLVAGAAYAGGKTQVKFDNDLGRLDLDAKGVNLYASVYRSSYYIDVTAGYGWTDLATDRHLSYTEGGGATIDQHALGKSHIHDLWAGINIGDVLSYGGVTLGPEASFNFHEIRLDGFAEAMSQPTLPGAGLALRYGAAVVPSMQGRVGLHLGYTISTSWGVFEPRIHGAFIREFRNHADTFSAQLAAAADVPGSGTAFIHTDTPEGHYFANGAGFTAQLRHGLSAFFDFEQLKTLKTIKAHEFSFGVRYQVGS
ncbi:MAG TPA: autotransporter outer membrane beta-barrel domain-containing protein [Steroidobacteraceae bacterium]|nr:autotransporter outer membrane beta-barrel domain-containing protein [Steroidobacteraceae bacterium]